jgi:hypothetical protein
MHLFTTRISTFSSLVLAAFLATGCQKQAAPDPYVATSPDTPASGPTFVGTLPAAPTQGAASESGSVKSDVSKAQQSNSMPLPGQANDHSNPEPPPKEKQNPLDVKK